jgi:hypothetical protein
MTYCVASTLTLLESSGLLPVGKLQSLCVFRSCSQHRDASAHCLPAYPLLSRDLYKVLTIHNKRCRSMHWVSWKTFWALLVNASFQCRNSARKCLRTIFTRTCSHVLVCGAHPEPCLGSVYYSTEQLASFLCILYFLPLSFLPVNFRLIPILLPISWGFAYWQACWILLRTAQLNRVEF